jgi:hypothetical protein
MSAAVTAAAVMAAQAMIRRYGTSGSRAVGGGFPVARRKPESSAVRTTQVAAISMIAIFAAWTRGLTSGLSEAAGVLSFDMSLSVVRSGW